MPIDLILRYFQVRQAITTLVDDQYSFDMATKQFLSDELFRERYEIEKLLCEMAQDYETKKRDEDWL